MTTLDQVEMGSDQQPGAINPFSPFGAPGFDMDSPLQFRLFDPQICGGLQDDWLAYAVEGHGITRAEMDAMIAGKLLRRSKDKAGTEGFLIYTEQQARVAKELQQTGRYSATELQHLFGYWNDSLATLSIGDLAYDDMDASDYESFRHHTRIMTDFFAEDIARMDHGFCPVPAEHIEAHKERARKLHAQWQRTRDYLAKRRDDDLTPEQRKSWRKDLHEIRFSDEMSRVMLAQAFMSQIEQGFSIEISFEGWETTNYTETIFSRPNWPATLTRFKEVRNEGKAFPLRTPDFSVTENGFQLVNPLSPEAYKALHEKYRLEELSTLIAAYGPALWQCDLAAAGRAACIECGTIFERTTSSRQYCSEPCRGRARGRRWRESDPERARRAQAKHYREAYPDG